MVALQHVHEPILQRIDILKLIDHDVFQTLLPLQLDILVHIEDIQREHDEVVVIKPEALLLLIQVPIEDDVARFGGRKIFLMQVFKRHCQHV